MILRPHHMLCTQAYEGKGYSIEFVKNMDRYIEKLRNEEGFKVTIKTKLDSLCSACPHNKGTVCESEDKILEMDKKVLKHFDIEEGTYEYQALARYIKSNMTREIFDDICGKCGWYLYGICEKYLL